MTSVSVVSAASERIRRLPNKSNSKLSEIWGYDDREELREDLESINQKLKAADLETKLNSKFVELEKKIVQLCYDNDDDIASAGDEQGLKSKPIRGRISRLFGSSENSKGYPQGSRADPSKISRQDSLGALERLKSPTSSDFHGSSKEDHQSRTAGIMKSATGAAEAAIKRVFGTSEKSSKGDLRNLKEELENTVKHRQSIAPETVHQANPASPLDSAGEDLARMENQVASAVLTPSVSVVCIWGDSGMGKTTLAKKIYHRADVRQYFHVFAWVTINQDFQTKNILQAVLLKLLPGRKADIKGMDEMELIKNIFTEQKKKCLVVLDDVAATEDWQNIRAAFPIGHSDSKILLTTRHKEVATKPDEGRFHLEQLSEAECLELLKAKAKFDEADCNCIRKKIFKFSDGSPITVIPFGKLFKAVDVDVRNQLLQLPDAYLSNTQNSDGKMQALKLIYHLLPHGWKPLLLYLGQFPADHNIGVKDLYSLLAADDLLQGLCSLLEAKDLVPSVESVRKILDELAFFRLVDVQEDKVSTTDMCRCCLLHDKIRDFCVTQSLNEDFFDIVDSKTSGENSATRTRRLAIHLRKREGGATIRFGGQHMPKKIRSLLIFDAQDESQESQKKSCWPSEINDLKEFCHLRILKFDGVDFRVRTAPGGFDKLVLLRYLSFRGCYLKPSLISFLSGFQSLETLDLRVIDTDEVIIPNDLLSNMKKLRHLYFPKLYKCEGEVKLLLRGLEKVEVLVNFDTEACEVEDLDYLGNIRIFTAVSYGNSPHLDRIIAYAEKKSGNLQQSSLDIRDFDCYLGDSAKLLKRLLEGKFLHSLHIEGQIAQLPNDVKISPSFTEMTLDNSELEDDPMSVLGKVENLRSLVLKNDAFLGDKMTILAASNFPNLRILKLLNLQYLEKLTFERGAMPKLSSLVIEGCDDLTEVFIPKALYDMLQNARERKVEGDDVFSVEPLLTICEDNI